MIRVFTTNENGNIELTRKELEELLQEAFHEGETNIQKLKDMQVIEVPSSTPPYTWPNITWTSTTPLNQTDWNKITQTNTATSYELHFISSTEEDT